MGKQDISISYTILGIRFNCGNSAFSIYMPTIRIRGSPLGSPTSQPNISIQNKL